MAKEKMEEGQIVLCTVDRIVGTIVFVKVEDYNIEGTITFSEISPGRIRNIRDFVFPGKKIACKVLGLRSNSASLSLRRVKLKEKTELNEKIKLEKSYSSVLKAVLGNSSDEIISKIKGDNSLVSLIEESKEDISHLAKFMNKKEAEKVLSIINERKVKEKIIQRRFLLTSKAPDGVVLIKNMMIKSKENSQAEILYLGGGRYNIKIKSQDLKQSDSELKKIIDNLEKGAKQASCTFLAEKS